MTTKIVAQKWLRSNWSHSTHRSMSFEWIYVTFSHVTVRLSLFGIYLLQNSRTRLWKHFQTFHVTLQLPLSLIMVIKRFMNVLQWGDPFSLYLFFYPLGFWWNPYMDKRDSVGKFYCCQKTIIVKLKYLKINTVSSQLWIQAQTIFWSP